MEPSLLRATRSLFVCQRKGLPASTKGLGGPSSLTCLNCRAPLAFSTWYGLGSPLIPQALSTLRLEGRSQGEEAAVY